MSAPNGVLDLGEIVRAALAPLAEKIDQLTAQVERLRGERADELLDIDQAAELLGTTPAALRKKLMRGTLPSVRVGRSVRVRRGDLVVEKGGGR